MTYVRPMECKVWVGRTGEPEPSCTCTGCHLFTSARLREHTQGSPEPSDPICAAEIETAQRRSWRPSVRSPATTWMPPVGSISSPAEMHKYVDLPSTSYSHLAHIRLVGSISVFFFWCSFVVYCCCCFFVSASTRRFVSYLLLSPGVQLVPRMTIEERSNLSRLG